MTILTRRQVAIGVTLLPFLTATGHAQTPLPKMTVAKDPNCGCCGSWANYLRRNGFVVDVVERTDMDRVRAQFGVPAALQSVSFAHVFEANCGCLHEADTNTQPTSKANRNSACNPSVRMARRKAGKPNMSRRSERLFFGQEL